jgi:peptidyl-prolyl cis-trans isomerase D
MEPKLTGAAFNAANKGKVSEPVAGNSSVFLFRTENIGLLPAGNLAYNDRRAQMEAGMKQSAANASLQSLRTAATVKDRRIKFY